MAADAEIRELAPSDLDALLEAYRSLLPDDEPAPARSKLEHVWAHPDVRRQGVGSAVIQTLLARCWSAGCYKVMLLSGTQRSGAHAFYERNGFDEHAKQGFVVRK